MIDGQTSNNQKSEDGWLPFLPYIGIPLIVAIFLVVRAGGSAPVFVLLDVSAIVFGYVAAVIDFKYKKIPNKLILVMLGTWVFIATPSLFFMPNEAVDMFINAGLGFLVGGGLFLLVYLVSRKGIGGGDVKFMAVMGLYVGLFGIFPIILYGTILAALTGLVLILLKKISRKDSIPLAPFLYVGILFTVFWL